jgi:arginase family enzyme
MDTSETSISLIERIGFLCAPPGAGWATSRSGEAPMAAAFHASAFDSTEPATVRARWLADVAASPPPQVGIIGIPYDGGTYGLAGAAAGPLGVRAALGGSMWREMRATCLDMGDVRFFPGPPLDEMMAINVTRRTRAVRYGDPAIELPICMLSAHRSLVCAATAAGMRVLSIGGDHSISASALMGISRHDIGLIHIDQHADLSTGRDGLELLHSSWIYYVDQRMQLPLVVQLGGAGLPAPEWIKSRLKRIPILCSALDPFTEAHKAVDWLAAAGVHNAYLSIDIDAVNTIEAPATGLPSPNGLPLDYLISFIRAIGEKMSIIGGDVVEVSPPLSGKREWDREPTCVSGSKLVMALIAALAAPPPLHNR